MKLQAILFDLDGTLLDSAPDFIAVANAMLKRRNLPVVDEVKLRSVVSGGAKDMISASFGITAQHPEFETLRLEFLAHYLEHCVVDSVCYEGITHLLAEIEAAGLIWGIVTNKPVRFAQPIVSQLFAHSAVLVCPEHVTHCKPSAEPLFLASQLLEIAPEGIVYVGDDKRDIDSGKAAGCYTIAVTYGYLREGDNPNTWGANKTMATVADLSRCIKQMIKSNLP